MITDDRRYMDFSNSLTFACPFCDQGFIKPSKMQKTESGFSGEPIEISHCDHLLARGNFSIETCALGVELFPTIQEYMNNTPLADSGIVQRIHGQEFAVFCRDIPALGAQINALPEPNSSNITCPHCLKRMPLGDFDPDAQMCEHALWWRDFRGGWVHPKLDDRALDAEMGDYRVRVEDQMFASACADKLPIKFRAAWNIDPESGAYLGHDEGIYSIFLFVPDLSALDRINKWLAAQAASLPKG